MPGPASAARARLRRLRAPGDYFAETRSSLKLWPEKILCFVRKSQREAASEPLARHHHHRYVLVVPWREGGGVYVDERRFLLKHPHALLIFPFQFHHGFNFKRAKILWQFVTFEMRDGAALEALRLNPLRKLEPEDFKLLSTLAGVWNDLRRRDELADWLALILKRMLHAPSSIRGDHPAESKNSSSLLLKINQHCLLHLHRVFGLKELAAHLSISESHLRASFRRETGMSLGQHLRRLRLQKAIGLLLQSDLSITQVAERCGFDSIFTFSRSFRRFTGITARDYRRRLAGDRRHPAKKNRKS
jgi:AraC-like DNA-binding protein